MNPNTNKNPLVIGLSVIIIILLVTTIVLATRKRSAAPAPLATDTTTQTPTPTTTPKRTAPKASSITGESGTPTKTGSSALVNEESDAYVAKVTKKDDGKYVAELDYIDWKYNPDLLKSDIVNDSQKLRTFELDKNFEISYVNNIQYPVNQDRREVFLNVVTANKLGQGNASGTNLFHFTIKDGKIISAVEIYRENK